MMMATVTDVRRIAREAVAARVAGESRVTIGTQTFDLTEGGMCLRFVRQCEEAAQGLQPHDWRFDSRYAVWADYKLRRAGLEVADHEHADIVCFNRGASEQDTPGHIGIYLGDGLVAENTISARRGQPRAAGTKLTALADIGPERAMFFATLPLAELQVVVANGAAIPCAPRWVGERVTVAYTPLARALGLPATNPAVHADTGRAFLREIEQFESDWRFVYHDRPQGPRVYCQRV